MKKIGFIGAFDKTDFILYIAKLLVEMGERVLFVDATVTQKAKYIVPNIQTSKAYITEFEGIDVAVGLRNFEEIKMYLKIPETNELPYDTVLIDTNSAGGVSSYKLQDSQRVYFATSFDLYSIRKGIESLTGIQERIKTTKILFSKEASKEENDYLNFLSEDSNIIWEVYDNGKENIIFMPFELGDQTTIYKNQRVSKIKLKGLTTQYKEGLLYVVNQIIGEENYQELRRIFKKVEKGV